MNTEEFGKITHLTPGRVFDSNSYWFKGGSFLKMDNCLYNEFEKALSEVKWVQDPAKVYNEIPEHIKLPESDIPKNLTRSQTRDLLNAHAKKNFPEELKGSIEKLLLSYQTEELQSLYNFQIVFADLWNGSEGCPWHWDGTDGGDALILAYFSDHKKWKPELGGQLEIGKNLGSDSMYLSKIGEVESYGFVPPQQRSFIIVNNKNPYFIHRCNKLIDPKIRRMTLTLGLKFVVKDDWSQPSKVIW
ncbi:hypothetical protein [Vibrio parahaemolyticus]|uniref:hypothetical protein n=1 Tax=Vibrio parahaemolyticus TaxID=670 RepID=UPI00226A01BF|nr:hypothetical protein [Vibrio parahaemolyticus]MCX8796607.1 hypothetical protein [Vibrio parahaemolyticus]